MTDIIQGDRFEKVADLTFAPPKRSSGDYSHLPNTFSFEKCKEFNPCIVYTHTFYVKDLFNVIRDINHKFIVVTHNCDTNIDFSPPGNVIKWFSQNVNIIHDRIESIPIGLENNRWFKDVRKKEKMMNKLNEPRVYKNLVYMNHNISTNPSKRQRPYDLLKDKDWVTTRMGANGADFDDYLDNIYNHKFVICPEGNGIDTHRIWECLYMGTIPIVVDNINNSFYKYELPITLVNDWSEVTMSFLIRDWDITPDVVWNMEMFTFEYWKNKIRNT